MMTMTKKLAAALAVMACIGCGPGQRRLLRSRSHLSALCRRMLPSLTAIMMLKMLMSSRWQLLNHRATKGAALLVVVADGRPTLPRLCSHPIRAEGAATASTLSLTTSG